MTDIHGEVAPGFEPVKAAFAENFDRHGDLGAAFSLYHQGKKVVDIWGGYADKETKKPWAQDSLQGVFSTTKGATAICANLLAQRGELDLDAPVAMYWPEFAQAGKQDIPVRWLLSHQAGLPWIPPLSAEDNWAWEPPVNALAAQEPAWEPGTAFGYHPGTYGWLVGEVIRRVTGLMPSEYFAQEVAGPLDLDFWIRLPEEQRHRVTRVEPIFAEHASPEEMALTEGRRKIVEYSRDPESLLTKAMMVHSNGGMDANSAEFRNAEQPAGGGHGTARSLARMYAGLIGDGVDGVRLFSDETLKDATTPRASGLDCVTGCRLAFGSGFVLNYPIPEGIEGYSDLGGQLGSDGAFGHNGAGGSLAYGDPQLGIGFGYVMNQMKFCTTGDDPRTLGLIQAVHQSLR